MDAVRGMRAASRRQGRCWHFASAVLDEDSWTLRVDGRRIPLEAKPMELLHELLLRAGQVVTKDELLDAVWPGIAVVEASLPTAMLKLRRALGDEKGEGRVIETVTRIGYRLAVPVEIEFMAETPAGDAAQPMRPELSPTRNEGSGATHRRRPTFVIGGLVIALLVGTIAALRMLSVEWGATASQDQARDAADAIRRMDVARVEQLLHEGWDPNVSTDDQGNGSLTWALNICEWNPAHDRQRLLLLVRTLIDGGARLDAHNVWGDTPFTIASAPRYCGADHPVTRMIGAMCYRGYKRTGTIPVGNFCALGPSTATPAQRRHAQITAH